ncbi:acyl--CoA ligase [Nocardiopsis dassonvillei]|uniref:class I adenylate-forming enzyme family protein n=1 Tax=Nocardiopsis dassonvillei TaxID=2014 RepID=UPI002010AF59|nr:class I adenylate-forming enzyme family protein [Nocardiopsis dassonvillei]MCK9868091.1 acyl--CoA ligase [Nocardiopsis dassonvillei]
MNFPELDPGELLASGFRGPHATGRPWMVRWDRVGSVDALVASAMPEELAFHTSGSTGDRVLWKRTRRQLWDEAGMLADLVREGAPEAVLTFAPPQHVYGALVSVLLPARLGLPVWFRPGIREPMPPTGPAHWLVASIPWTFSLMRPGSPWVGAARELTLVHSTAALPATARRFMEDFEGSARLVEVLGSTETGGVAHRRWSPGADEPPWRLFDDVRFDESMGRGPGERRLALHGPRVVRPPGSADGAPVLMDDYVEVLGERRFRLVGRRDRLVKVNGYRIDLRQAEDELQTVIDCSDLALLPRRDEVIGEHFDLLLVRGEDGAPDREALERAVARLPVRPRRIRFVPGIERSENGKVRANQ